MHIRYSTRNTVTPPFGFGFIFHLYQPLKLQTTIAIESKPDLPESTVIHAASNPQRPKLSLHKAIHQFQLLKSHASFTIALLKYHCICHKATNRQNLSERVTQPLLPTSNPRRFQPIVASLTLAASQNSRLKPGACTGIEGGVPTRNFARSKYPARSLACDRLPCLIYRLVRIYGRSTPNIWPFRSQHPWTF